MFTSSLPTVSRRFIPGCLLAALAAFAPAALRAQAPVVSSLTYLDALYAYGVNDSGQVVGLSTTYRAYLWDSGTFTNITPAGGGTSYAYGINNSGQAVGYSTLGGTPTAFVYSGGTSTALGGELGGISYGRAINDAGTIAGDLAYTANSFTRTAAGTLSTFGTGSNAFAINNQGVVAGSIPDSGFIYSHAAIYHAGTATDLGTLGGTISYAYAINDSGLVVGYSYITGSSNTHAFAYSGGVMSDLGTLGGATSTARDVNNLGQIVGNSAGTGFVGNHAFLYTDGEMFDLTTAAQAAGFVNTGPITASTVGFTSLDIAYAISDTGFIVGTGTYYTGNWVGQQRAFLLQLETTAVPEPAAEASLAGLGALLIVGIHRRSRRARAARSG